VWKMWRRGYAVAAVGPLDGGGGYHCYATGVDAEEFDVPEVPEVRPARRPARAAPAPASTPGAPMCGRAAQMVRALRHILTENRWWHLPRYAAGASRGGAFALILALHFPLQARARSGARNMAPRRPAPQVTCMGRRAQGVGSMVMGMKPLELLDGPLVPGDAHTNATWAYPPVLLMQAANDQPDVVGIIDRTILVFAAKVRSTQPQYMLCQAACAWALWPPPAPGCCRRRPRAAERAARRASTCASWSCSPTPSRPRPSRSACAA